MKLFAILILTIGLAACGASQPTKKGAGFDSLDHSGNSNSSTPLPSVSGATSTPQVASGNREPGLYQTATGVPWNVYQSINVRRGRSPVTGRAARSAAMSYGSHKWDEPYAIPIAVTGGTGMFAIVSVDGSTYAVLRKVKASFFDGTKKRNALSVAMIESGISKAGCSLNGPIISKMGSYESLVAVSAPVSC